MCDNECVVFGEPAQNTNCVQPPTIFFLITQKKKRVTMWADIIYCSVTLKKFKTDCARWKHLKLDLKV